MNAFIISIGCFFILCFSYNPRASSVLATQSKKKGKHIKKVHLVPEGSPSFVLSHKIFCYILVAKYIPKATRMWLFLIPVPQKYKIFLTFYLVVYII